MLTDHLLVDIVWPFLHLDVFFDKFSFASLVVGCLEIVLGILEGESANHIGFDSRNKVIFGLKSRSVGALLLGHMTGQFSTVRRRRLKCCHFSHLLREILLHRLELICLKAVGSKLVVAL